MADIYLSSIATTTSLTGTYVYIIVPDGGSSTGFTSYRIAITDLHADLQSAINTNTANIATNTSDISRLQDIVNRQKFANQTAAFEFSQTADSTIEKFRFLANSSTLIKIGTTIGGEEILEETTVSTDEFFEYDETLYSASARTIYISVTGSISCTIYYTSDEF
jgi:hypothetical protein